MSSTLSFYWDLASVDPEKRLAAAEQLIATLKTFQNDHSTKNDITTHDELNSLAAPDVAYAFKRLTRGLSSSRDGARHGFSLALSQLLKLIPTIHTSLVLQSIHDASEKNGSKTGQEERELYFARIFGYLAIAEAGLLQNKTTQQDISLICENLKKYSDSKDYLKHACAKVLISILKHAQLSEHKNEFSDIIINSYLKEGVSSLEHAWFVLEAQNIAPEFAAWGTLLPDWKKSNIIHLGNKSKLIELLKTATYHDVKLHSIYPCLLSALSSSEGKKNMTLFEFWSAIDESFFNASHDRKFLGFQIFEHILPLVNAEQIPLVFTPNFLRCLINSLSSKETYLNKQARKTTVTLSTLAAEKPQVALPLVLQLLGKHGHYKFDHLTKTKTVENILGALTVEGITEYLDHLTAVFFDPSLVTLRTEDAETNRNDTVRLWVIDQMALLIRTGKIVKTEKWLTYAVEFIITHGFFTVKSKGKSPILREVTPALSATTLSSIQSKLMPSLGHLNHIVLKAGHPGQLTNGDSWAYTVVTMFEKLRANKHVSMTITEETSQGLQKAAVCIQKIRKSISISGGDKTKISELCAFEDLFTHLSVQLYSDSTESADVIDDLEECYGLIFVDSVEKGGKKRKADSDEDEETLAPVEVLVDILFSFLAKPSSVLRSLSSDVFKVFSGKCTSKVIDLFFEVLGAQGGVAGAEELFEDEAEAGDMDVEDESEDDGESDEETDDEAPVDEVLKAKIQAALATDVEQDLEDLNDDDMAVFDSKLAEIFGQRKAIKNVKKETKENVLHFKLRVVDLLDIFFKASIKLPIILDALIPLLRLYFETAGSDETKLLHAKLGSLIRNRVSNSKDYPFVSYDKLVGILEQVLDMTCKISDAGVFGVFSGVTLWLVKAILHASKHEGAVKTKKAKKAEKTPLQQVAALFMPLLTNYVNIKNSRVRPALFVDLATRCPTVAFELVEDALNLINPTVRAFQAVKTLEICALALKNMPKTDDETVGVETTKKLTAFSSTIRDVLSRAISDSASDKGAYGMPRDRVKTLLKSVVGVWRRYRLPLGDSLATVWHTTELKLVLGRVSGDERVGGKALSGVVGELVKGM